MTVPTDPYLQGGPLPPAEPRDPNRDTELPLMERGQDPLREEIVDTLATEPERPLTDDEEDAAKHDPGRAPRTYAPASERVAKPPAPGDEKLIRAGETMPTDEMPAHPGDSSDPAEMR